MDYLEGMSALGGKIQKKKKQEEGAIGSALEKGHRQWAMLNMLRQNFMLIRILLSSEGSHSLADCYR